MQQIKLKNSETIYYFDVNTDSTKEETIILIHGNYSTSMWWDEVVQGLKPLGYRIIIPDLRGFGKSTYKNICSRFADWAQDIIQLCEIHKLKKIILNGWSFGGAVSMKIADLNPELVSRLILTCSIPKQGLFTKDQNGQVPRVKQDIVKIPKIAYAIKIVQNGNKEGMRQIFDMVLYSRMKQVSQKRKAELAETPFLQRCYPDLLEAIVNSDIKPQNIKAQTLIIHGNEDIVIPVNLLMNTSQKLGKMEIWENHAHMIPLQDNQRYNKRIIDFITK